MPTPLDAPESRSDRELDRLLAGGRPAGAELDALWDRLAPNVVAKPSWQTSWRRRLSFAAIPAALAATLVAVVVQRTATKSDDGLAMRGDDTAPASAGAIEASCGANDHPCVVGEALVLRLRGAQAGDVGYVILDGETGPAVIAGPIALQPGKAVDVPVVLRPEDKDVATGLQLRAVFLPSTRATAEVLTSPSHPLRIRVRARSDQPAGSSDGVP
jgi:hypothetical protein